MDKYKRKKFFLKGNFQFAFIIGFTVFLLIDVILVSCVIYGLSWRGIEKAAFSSHIFIHNSLEIVLPIILRVNIYAFLITLLFASGLALIVYYRLISLFGRIISGLNQLKAGNTSIRLELYGNKSTRELLKEFNHAAAYLDRQMGELKAVLDSLDSKTDLKEIAKLHSRLYSLIKEN